MNPAVGSKSQDFQCLREIKIMEYFREVALPRKI